MTPSEALTSLPAETVPDARPWCDTCGGLVTISRDGTRHVLAPDPDDPDGPGPHPVTVEAWDLGYATRDAWQARVRSWSPDEWSP